MQHAHTGGIITNKDSNEEGLTKTTHCELLKQSEKLTITFD